MNSGYRECLSFICFFYCDYFLVCIGVIEIFMGVRKSFKICRYSFFKLKSYKLKNCPRSIYYTRLSLLYLKREVYDQVKYMLADNHETFLEVDSF